MAPRNGVRGNDARLFARTIEIGGVQAINAGGHTVKTDRILRVAIKDGENLLGRIVEIPLICLSRTKFDTAPTPFTSKCPNRINNLTLQLSAALL